MDERVQMSNFPSRRFAWIAAAAAVLAGCAGAPGVGANAHGAHKVAEGKQGSDAHTARAVPGRGAELASVSCARPDACVAVGGSLGSKPGQFHPLAEVWNGTTWRVLTTAALPAGVFGSLGDVSCPAIARCLAVGSTGGRGDAAIAEAWNGTRWRLLRLRYPRGAVASVLSGVSCVRHSCLLVGSYQRRLPGQPLPLAFQFRGGRVLLLRPGVPAGRKHAELSGVSCAAASACMAVGHYLYPAGHNAPPGLAFADAWDGTRWRLIKVPTPDRAPDSELGRVWCVSATRCLATGSFDFLTAVSGRPLIEAWQPDRWRPVSITGSRLNRLFPAGVACRSASSCILVGDMVKAGADHPGAEIWNGRALRLLPVPQVSEGSLAGISCPSPRRCVAVGSARRGQLAELWNGKTWRVLPGVR